MLDRWTGEHLVAAGALASRLWARLGPRLLVLALALGGASCRTSGKLYCRQQSLAVDRRAAVFTTYDAVYLVRSGKARVLRVARREDACLGRGADTLLLLRGRSRLLLHGIEARMAFDLFGHAGRRLTVSCLYDFVAGAGRSNKEVFPQSRLLQSAPRGGLHLQQGRHRGLVYITHTSGSYQAFEMADPETGRVHRVENRENSGDCVLYETPRETRDICVARDGKGLALVMRRWDQTKWPPRTLPPQRLPVLGAHWVAEPILSPDRRRLAYHLQLRPLSRSKVPDWVDRYVNVVQIVDIPSWRIVGQRRYPRWHIHRLQWESTSQVLRVVRQPLKGYPIKRTIDRLAPSGSILPWRENPRPFAPPDSAAARLERACGHAR